MDDLFPYFERSVLAVQSYANSFEEAYGKPAAARLKRFYHKRPLLSVCSGVSCDGRIEELTVGLTLALRWCIHHSQYLPCLHALVRGTLSSVTFVSVLR